MAGSVLSRLVARAAKSPTLLAPWHKLPRFLGILSLIGIRTELRGGNLYDTSVAPTVARPTPPADGAHRLTARTEDGTYNDLNDPLMGSAGSRFGRNFPLRFVHPEPEPALLEPNPRTISRELLARDTFKPATILNLLAASWINFMVHDWLSHGENETDNPYEVPLAQDDRWPERPMRIRRTRRDPTRPAGSNGAPPTYTNVETHWWDASQIYGSQLGFAAKIRSGEGGKLKVGRDGLLPLDPETGLDITGVTRNYWVGLSMLHTLFSMEHNAICDRLRAEYRSWSDDDLFDRARLINAALIAKIHTVEWTPAILIHPTTKKALHSLWYGAAPRWLSKPLRRVIKSEVISGTPGSKTHHHGAPYAITEEFLTVYRLHPLLPDEIRFRSAVNDELLQERGMADVLGRNTRTLQQQVSTTDLFYSFGTSHPGAITLHNYPLTLRQFKLPDGTLIDLAATDVMRDRERGIPRYNMFRQLVHMPAIKTFDALTTNKEWAEELRRIYDNDIDRVDTMVGMFAEPVPRGFGFSETAFRIFVLMASRRLKSDRFFTRDFNPKVYTPSGFEWIEKNTMSTVLLRHHPGLEPLLRHVDNAFAPWPLARS